MSSRFAGVEGLRAFACLSVVLAHSWFLNPLPPSQAAGPAHKLVPYINFNLFSGLTLFFVLSGFLLYFPFARAVMEQRSLPSVPRFLRNRALRIMPAYWVVLLVTLLAGAAVTNSGYIAAVNHHDFSDVGHVTDPGLLTLMFLLVQNYLPDYVTSGIGVTWTLTVEIAFYLLLPLLAVAALKVSRKPAIVLLPPLALLAVGSTCKLIAAATGPGIGAGGRTWHHVFGRSILCNADLFAYGMLAAIVLISALHGRKVNPRICGAAALIVALPALVLHTRGVVHDALFHPLMALSFGLLILYVTLPGGRSRLLETRPLRYVGKISYSVYLWHLPILLWLAKHHGLVQGKPGVILNPLLLVVLTLAASAVTFKYVEDPAMKRKRSLRLAPQGTEQLSAP